jgi:trehalose 6-phosphate synthase/phosphatase
LVAEHGAVIKKAGAKKWKNIENIDTEWKKMILPVLEKYTSATPHAMIEIKPHSLVWHYRGAPSYAAQKNAVIIKRVLKPLLKKYAIQIYQGNKILEIKDPQINKGNAVHHWLSPSHDFILAIGDDYTDEDLFETLSNTAYTIKVGNGRTKAAYRVKSVDEVTALLEKLNK